MTHAITITNGKAEMAYTGATPWHGLGAVLKQGAPIDDWIKAAGMQWEVHRADVQYNVPTLKKDLTWEERTVLYRGDNGFPLGVVSKGYKIVQPAQVMEFFRDLCDSNKFSMETAGTLFGGRQYWALAKLGDQADIVKGDTIKGYLLLTTSADGTKSTTAKFVSTRVVCNNTLSMAMREHSAGNRVSVSHRSEFKADSVKLDLGIAHQVFDEFTEICKTLTTFKLSEDDSKKTLGLMLVKANMAKEAEVEECRAFAKILTLYKGDGKGAKIAGVDGTAWGLLNAVTEFVDHHRAREASPSTRLSNNVWGGSGERLKNTAFLTGLDIINGTLKLGAKVKDKVVAAAKSTKSKPAAKK